MSDKKRFLVSGGCGFIGSHLVDLLLSQGHDVLILDALSWGANLENLPLITHTVGGLPGQMVSEIPAGDCVLVVGDVGDLNLVKKLVNLCDGVFHLAAQTHVDRSYGDVMPFVHSNVVGAYAILEAVRAATKKVRLVFVSTDEVYGDITSGESSETDPIEPRNVYSALKAGGDLLAQRYASIFKVDLVIARPANNYGPRQFEEKLMPKVITSLIDAKYRGVKAQIPVYGDGGQVRDWLYVKDTAQALWEMYERGKAGEIYNLVGGYPRTVLDVVSGIASYLGLDWKEHVKYVEDRICGDRRYAMNPTKTLHQLGWKAKMSFEDGVPETITWYRKHKKQY